MQTSRLSPVWRVLWPLLALMAGLGACGRGAESTPTATAASAANPRPGVTYTHPSEAFRLTLPAGWELVSEDIASASFAPGPEADSNPAQATSVAMVVTYTGMPLSAAALEKFARQFALDDCPEPGKCEVHGLHRAGEEEVWVGMDYRPTTGPEQRINFSHRRVGEVVYTLIISAQGPKAMPGLLRSQIWEGAQLNAEAAARRLPLYAARTTFRLDFDADEHMTGHPRVHFERPIGWASEQVSQHTATVDYTHALATSPDGLFALHIYIGHDAQPQYERIYDRALLILQDLLNIHADAVVVDYQHMDLEGRWLLSWAASPSNARALTLADARDDHLVMLTGVTASSLWSLAEPLFSDLVLAYTYEE